MDNQSTPAPAKPYEAQRLSFFFIATFAVIGIHMPYWPVWLDARGLTASEISALTALAFATKIFVNPLFAQIADKRGERKSLILILSTASLLGFFLFFWTHSFWPIFLVTAIVSSCYSTIMPLTDSLTMLSAKKHNLDYGRIRLWGSLSFIIAVAGFGRLLVGSSTDIIFWGVILTSALMVVAAWMLPDTRAPKAASDTRFTLLPLLRDKRFMTFVLAATCVQSTHAVYYTFGTLNWQAAGHSEDLIGLLWAVGVIAEILLFAFGRWLMTYLSAMRLIALGGLAGLIRWSVTGYTDEVAILFAMQILHAFTFGAAHLGAIHFIANQVDPAVSATAQSLYGAIVMGAGMGLAMLLSGMLYANFGGQAYYAMAVLGGVGGLIAFSIARPRHSSQDSPH